MNELLQILLQSIPNMAGLIIAVWVLYTLINRLMDDIGERLDRLEVRIEKIDDRTR